MDSRASNNTNLLERGLILRRAKYPIGHASIFGILDEHGVKTISQEELAAHPDQYADAFPLPTVADMYQFLLKQGLIKCKRPICFGAHELCLTVNFDQLVPLAPRDSFVFGWSHGGRDGFIARAYAWESDVYSAVWRVVIETLA